MADTMHALEKNSNWKGRRGPVVLVIMDGVGYGKYVEGDAVKASKMKYLDWFTANCPHTKLKAHGTAVGLPSDDDMGNSEVGHNAIGCGRVFAQGVRQLAGDVVAAAAGLPGHGDDEFFHTLPSLRAQIGLADPVVGGRSAALK